MINIIQNAKITQEKINNLFLKIQKKKHWLHRDGEGNW